MNEKSDFWKISEKKLFFICLAIAAILWLFNALSQDYRHQVDYELSYVNLPDDQIPTIPLVEQVTLNCSGEGFDLLKALWFRPQRLVIDYKDHSSQSEIKPERLSYFPSSDPRNAIDVLSISPIVLPISFQEKAEKKIPLLVDTLITTAPLWFVSNFTLNPDSITVKGPSDIVENVTNWITAPIALKDIDKNTTGTAKLISSNYFNLSVEPAEVKYRLTIDQWTEKQLKAPIIPTGIEKEFEVFLYPREVDVQFQVPLSLYEVIDTGDFQILAHFDEIDVTKDKKVPISLKMENPIIKNALLNRSMVEFILYKE